MMQMPMRRWILLVAVGFSCVLAFTVVRSWYRDRELHLLERSLPSAHDVQSIILEFTAADPVDDIAAREFRQEIRGDDFRAIINSLIAYERRDDIQKSVPICDLEITTNDNRRISVGIMRDPRPNLTMAVFRNGKQEVYGMKRGSFAFIVRLIERIRRHEYGSAANGQDAEKVLQP